MTTFSIQPPREGPAPPPPSLKWCGERCRAAETVALRWLRSLRALSVPRFSPRWAARRCFLHPDLQCRRRRRPAPGEAGLVGVPEVLGSAPNSALWSRA